MRKVIVLAIALSMVLINGGFLSAQAGCLSALSICSTCIAPQPVCVSCAKPAPTAAGPVVAGESCDLGWTINCALEPNEARINPAMLQP